MMIPRLTGRSPGMRLKSGCIRRVQGFTLLEIMLVILCLFLLMGPIFRILRSGTRTSLKGMMQVETTLTARNVLRQVRMDLEHACLAYSGKGFQLDPELLFKTETPLPDCRYSFLVFTHLDSIDSAFMKDNKDCSWRLPSKVTYRVEPHPKRQGFKRLIRLEKFHPKHPAFARYPSGEMESILSDQVNLFEIRPYLLVDGTAEAHIFRITVQLIDVLPGREGLELGTVAGGGKRPLSGAIAEYFDVVRSDFFQTFRQRHGFNVNWQTGIISPE